VLRTGDVRLRVADPATIPDATIVIPCFNYGRFISDAVGSALGQRGADVRVVVVDDGSDDGTTPAACDALACDRVIVIHQPNAGPAAARNRGASAATSEFLVFLDADDTIEPEFVRTLAAAIEADHERGRVSHAYCQEVLTDQASGTWRVPEWDPMLLMVTNLHPITTLVRRRCFEEVGGFDASLGGLYEDWDLWLRFAARGWRGVRVREPLFHWRRHSQDTMVMRAVLRHDEIYRALLERHRGLYERHAMELLALSNSLLRKFDCNWIDETGYPISLQHWWSLRDRMIAAESTAQDRAVESERLRAEGRALAERLASLESEMDRMRDRSQDGDRRLDELRAHYESYTAIRIHRLFHRVLSRLPAPIAWLPRKAARTLRSFGR
jgi:glycosyltransferase involved in cell wall biosynthesis